MEIGRLFFSLDSSSSDARAPISWHPEFCSSVWRCDKPMDHAAPASLVQSKEERKAREVLSDLLPEEGLLMDEIR